MGADISKLLAMWKPQLEIAHIGRPCTTKRPEYPLESPYRVGGRRYTFIARLPNFRSLSQRYNLGPSRLIQADVVSQDNQ